MRTSRKIARRIVSGIKTAGVVGGTVVAGTIQFVADVTDEGVLAFEAIGDYIEKELEKMDESS